MLRKSCASHFFNGKMNGYAPEKGTSHPLVLRVNGYTPEKSADLIDFIHFYVLLGTDGHQKEAILALLAADCNPGKLNGYAPEYVLWSVEIKLPVNDIYFLCVKKVLKYRHKIYEIAIL